MNSPLSAGKIIGRQLQTVDASAGMTVAYRWSGLAFTAAGEIYVQDLGSSSVPAGAQRGAGLTFGSDGRLYVTSDAPAATANRGVGLVTRADGALHVSGEAITTSDSVSGGIARAANGALRTSGFLPSSLANLAAWFRFNQGITSAANAVSQWDDATGNGRHLKQATGAAQPALQGDGTILFGGADDFMATDAFTLNQPCSYVFFGRHITWTSGDAIITGVGANAALFQTGSTPEIAVFGGSSSLTTAGLVLNTYGAVFAVFNNLSSLIQVNAGAPVSGSVGTNNPGGIKVGTSFGGTAFGHFQAKEIVVYASAIDASARALLYAYGQRMGFV